MSKALQAPKASRKVQAVETRTDLTDLPQLLVHLAEWQRDIHAWESTGKGAVTRTTTEDVLAARAELMEECYQARHRLLEGTTFASRIEIAKSLTILAGCFPNADNKDLTVYGQMAVIDVEAQRPTRLQLQSAFTRLRRTKTFLPSICEIIEAVRETTDYKFYFEIITSLQVSLADAEKTVLQIEEDKRQRRANWLEDAVRRVSDGKSTYGIPADIVSEAKRIAGIEDEGGYW